MSKGVVGASVLELDFGLFRDALGEKVKFQRYFYWVSAKSGGGKLVSTSSYLHLPEL
jgi:hypothetical protein